MKSEKLLRILLCIFIAITVFAFCSANVFAEDDTDTQGNNDFSDTYEETSAPAETEPYSEPETEYVPEETAPETEPETEYVPEETEPETEYVPEETEPETEYVPATETAEPETYAWYGGVEETTVNPTQLSTSMVSMKPYETNYAAGVVSWVCVIVGVIVISAVLISTKHSGNKKLRADEEYYSVRR